MTTDAVADLKVSIEPFDPAKHDRAAFSCGNARIDNFIKRTAKKHQQGDFTRVWVAVGPKRSRVLGYYAINSHAIVAADLPSELTKNAPNHGYVPAAYLSIIGVDTATQGRGLGSVLLANACKRIATVSEHLGVAVIVLDVLDDGDTEAMKKRQRFYANHGFASFPSRPRRMFIPVKAIRDAP